MANTWHGSVPSTFPPQFDIKKQEGTSDAVLYRVRRAPQLEYAVKMPNGTSVSAPVETVIGGKRHGLSFLARIDQIDGMPLDRPALAEARYAYNGPHSGLVLSPGFDTEQPRNLEDALGRVLSPSFEQRCLRCHGEPNTLGAGTLGGVRCESCHGPAADHLASVTGRDPQKKLIIPEKLTGARTLEVCAQCHTGLSNQTDPMPDDLLVSSQVPALRNSECFVQSGEGFGCTDCHNPHEDSPRVVETSVQTCLRCHSAGNAKHAAICPINGTGECIQCHMPPIQKGAFLMTDHWIRVHPEQGLRAATHGDKLRSRVEPKREFLRIIVTEDRTKADAAAQRLSSGDSFSKVAHDMSIDPTAPGGGFIGDMDLSQMDAKLAAAAAQLLYGETSPVIDLRNRCIILHRLSRDFKWEANRLFEDATSLKSHGDVKGAIAKDQQALDVYPYFLRALVFMGTSLGETGNADRASQILQFAVQFYPKDASAEFDLGLTLQGRPAEQIEAFRRAIELDPDMTSAYESLGAALYSAGQPQIAIETFRKGLQVDPLSAKLNYDLGLALSQQGEAESAARAIALAKELDPAIAPKDAK
ncbi:MAG: peptidylprolyl isomerase [Acidobacteria bacterium]|nr:peptidylprolyl isomerase [Acidobacteriota bacterium]